MAERIGKTMRRGLERPVGWSIVDPKSGAPFVLHRSTAGPAVCRVMQPRRVP